MWIMCLISLQGLGGIKQYLYYKIGGMVKCCGISIRRWLNEQQNFSTIVNGHSLRDDYHYHYYLGFSITTGSDKISASSS